ncbi:hypothetical protein GUJ93_ZPchr0010g9441 [Zizania palustris]|uniref:Uncharacterized protein n=1 Tax=Zizania palustris TaxID=103762 RepID=A0A8J5W8A7_ZIZPA|nr:hypothetical protein GUJ93_ZPchr0010g9441 [Zizania palustris]
MGCQRRQHGREQGARSSSTEQGRETAASRGGQPEATVGGRPAAAGGRKAWGGGPPRVGQAWPWRGVGRRRPKARREADDSKREVGGRQIGPPRLRSGRGGSGGRRIRPRRHRIRAEGGRRKQE